MLIPAPEELLRNPGALDAWNTGEGIELLTPQEIEAIKRYKQAIEEARKEMFIEE
jgi:hypothetical protein